MAIYNKETDEYQTFCKVMSGMTDEFYMKQLEIYSEASGNLLPKADSRYRIHPLMMPDVFFKPVAVWEIRGSDITISPVHQAAAGRVFKELTKIKKLGKSASTNIESKGLSLRFPRFIRLREDKSPDQATTADEVLELFVNQAQIRKEELDVASGKET